MCSNMIQTVTPWFSKVWSADAENEKKRAGPWLSTFKFYRRSSVLWYFLPKALISFLQAHRFFTVSGVERMRNITRVSVALLSTPSSNSRLSTLSSPRTQPYSFTLTHSHIPLTNISSLLHFPLLRYPIPPIHLVCPRLSPPSALALSLSLHRHPYHSFCVTFFPSWLSPLSILS